MKTLNNIFLKQQQNHSKVTIFLHGFLGNARNLKPLASHPLIASQSDSVLFDVTNHGDSFHRNSFEFSDLTEDVVNSMKQLNLFEEYEQGLFLFKDI